MRVGDIEILPLAAETMGVRSLCTAVATPDLRILFDPSAGLAKRYGLEPHLLEYRALQNSLERIFVEARKADVLSVSHYHFDHIRPGFTNFRYNLSSREELQLMFEDKVVLAKDNRENINPSQRRRGYYFQKDVEDVVRTIKWSDGKRFYFEDTMLTYSPPLSHGPESSPLGYVVATCVEHDSARFVFAPDVQGPVQQEVVDILLKMNPDLMVVGGPPIYLHVFSETHRNAARKMLCRMASVVPVLVVDHHLQRSPSWERWLSPVYQRAEESGNCVTTMAEIAGEEVRCLEADRQLLYETDPPPEEFMVWTQATDEYKNSHMPPL
ncbi:hypothetical protein EU545_01280 [Candidatus Thorarchaeota archaeon]|nr:MAG: hypothetical protein EU545_01280 [Candidatus Thorarchaeota archaeon]